MKHRTHPLRVAGIPIIGQQREGPASGAYYYWLPVLIQWEGQQLEADGFECEFSMPLEGTQYLRMAAKLRASVAERHPDRPAPRLVPLAPVFLGFVPQAELERRAAAAQAEESKPEVAIQ